MVASQLTKIIIFLMVFLSLSTPHEQGLFYIESWKKGDTKIQEQELLININTTDSSFQTNIKDSAGKEKYVLTVSSGIKQIENQSKIININIYLSEISSFPKEENLLRTQIKDQFQDCIGCDPISETLWIIAADPTDGNYLPILTERIIKIESFYCIIKVKKHKLLFSKEPTLESASIQINLTNTWKCP